MENLNSIRRLLEDGKLKVLSVAAYPFFHPFVNTYIPSRPLPFPLPEDCKYSEPFPINSQIPSPRED